MTVRRQRSFPGAQGRRRRRNSILVTVLAAVVATTAAGQNWEQAPGIPSEPVYAIARHGGLLFAATDSTVYSGGDSGTAWSPAPAQPPASAIQTLFSFGGALHLGSLVDGVFRTDDGGATWEALNGGLAGGSKVVVAFASRGDTLYAGTGGNGVYVLGGGSPPSWTAYNAGLFQFGTSSLISSGTHLVGALGQYVFHRASGAPAWTDATVDSLGNRTPIKLHDHGDALFLGTSGGVFRGDTTGATWVKADISQFANAEVVAFASDGPRCYAGLNYQGQHWIFSTDDLGSSWDVRAHEFAGILVLLVDGPTLWAGRTDGLWKLDIGGTTGADDGNPGVPRGFSLDQNHPNPFNPATTFSFTLPFRARATLEVVDLLGRVVATPLDRAMGPGRHEIRWDAAGLPSGTYLYRLRAGNYADAKKLLLVR